MLFVRGTGKSGPAFFIVKLQKWAYCQYIREKGVIRDASVARDRDMQAG